MRVTDLITARLGSTRRNRKIKGVKPPLSIEVQYRQSLRSLVAEINKQLVKSLYPFFADREKDYATDTVDA